MLSTHSGTDVRTFPSKSSVVKVLFEEARVIASLSLSSARKVEGVGDRGTEVQPVRLSSGIPTPLSTKLAIAVCPVADVRIV